MKAFFDDVILDERYLWTIFSNVNILVKIDRSTGKIVKSTLLEGGNIIGGHCYCHIKKVDDLIIFLPTHNEPIIILHLENEEIEYVNREDWPEWLYSVFMYNGKFYMLSVKDQDFLLWDLEDNRIEHTDFVERSLEGLIFVLEDKYTFWHHRCYIEDREVYLSTYEQNYFIKVDLLNKTAKCIHCFDDYITDFIYFKKYFWFSLNNGEIVVLNLENGFQDIFLINTINNYFFVYNDELFILQKENWRIGKAAIYGGHIVFDADIEDELNSILKKVFNKNSDIIAIAVYSENEIFIQNKSGAFLKISNKEYFYSEGIEIDLSAHKNEIQFRNKCCLESSILDIKDFFEIVGLCENEETRKECKSTAIGELIYTQK